MLDPLDTPIVWLDTETTGIGNDDRVIQIGVIKVKPDGTETEWETLVNPESPIPPEATEIHGITDAMVINAPTFAKLGPTLYAGFRSCDYGGYSVEFDIRMLRAEFERANLPDPFNGRIVDACRIFKAMESRKLGDAVKRYLGEDMVGAHDALTDIRYTKRVLEAQLREYTTLPKSVADLHRHFFETPRDGFVDPEGRLAWRFGEAVFAFGKNAGTPLARTDKSYLKWILDNDFEESFKNIIRGALKGQYPRKDNA